MRARAGRRLRPPSAPDLLGLGLLLSLGGCLAAPPEPVAEPPSPHMIYAVVQLQPLRAERAGEQAAQAVTRTLLAEFQRHEVFEQVGLRPHNPDFILSGTLLQWSEQVTTPPWTSLPVIGVIGKVLGFSIRHVSSEVSLELTLAKPRGEALRLYKGRAALHEAISAYDGIQPGDLLNAALVEAVGQIREQLRRDRRRLMATAAPTGRAFNASESLGERSRTRPGWTGLSFARTMNFTR